MEDRLSRFLFATYDSVATEVGPNLVSSVQGLAAAVMEVNGLFVESKVPLRSTLISIHAGTAPGKINPVRESPLFSSSLVAREVQGC